MKKSAANEPASEDQFGQGFSRKLKHHEAAPGADLWSRIELTLDKDEALVYKKRWKLYSRLTAAVLALLMVAGGSFYYKNLHQPETVAVVSNPAAQRNQEVNASVGTAKSNKPAGTENHSTGAAGKTEAETDAASGTGGHNQQENAVAVNGEGSQPVMPAKNLPVKTQHADNNPGSVVALGGDTKAHNQEAALEVANTGISAGTSPAVKATAKSKARKSGNKNIVIVAGVTTSAVKEPAGTGVSEKAGIAGNHSTAVPSKTGPEASVKETSGSQETGATAAVSAANRQPENAAGSAESRAAGMELMALRTVLPVTLPDTMKKALPVLAFMPDSGKHNPPVIAANPLSKWSVGASYTVQQFRQNLELAISGNEGGGPGKSPIITRDAAGLNAAQKEFNASTRSAYSWQSQVHTGYQIFPKWQLQSGILYTVNQAQAATSYLIHTVYEAIPGPVTPAGPAPLIVTTLSAGAEPEAATISKTEKFTTTFRYAYIGLPVAVQFQPRISNRFQGSVSFGANFNRLIQNSITTDKAGVQHLDFNASDADSPFRKWQVAVAGSAGFSFNISANLKFSVAAEANYFVEPLVDQDKLPVHADLPYTIGLKTGLSYQFNKAAAKAK